MPLIGAIPDGGSAPPPAPAPIGITLPPPEPPTAPATLGSAPLVSSTPGAGQGVALTSAGFLPSDVTPGASQTPSLTAVTVNPNTGTGASAVGKYTRIGRWVFGYSSIVFGTAAVAAGTGAYRIALPVQAATAFVVVGSVMLYDSSAGAVRAGVLQVLTGGVTAQFIIDAGVVTDALPWVWAANDEIRVSFMYEAATA